MNTTKDIVFGIIGFLLSLAMVYFCYYIAKTVSYSIFYEDMVIQTIQETVTRGSLK